MTTEQQLPDALRQLDDALNDLCGVRISRDQHGTYTAPSLYVQLKQAFQDRPRDPGNTPGFKSHPTAWIAGIDKHREIETCARDWAAPQRGDTHTLLLGLIDRPWRPQDTKHILDIAHTINGWVDWITQALGESTTAGLRDAVCPNPDCGEGPWIWRRIDGDNMRITALTATIIGDTMDHVVCAACRRRWNRSELGLLGLMLGEQRLQLREAS